MIDIIGQTIGEYLIEASLGAGPIGQVFRVAHKQTRQQRVLKLLHQPLADDDGFRKRFVERWRKVADLRSRHIVAVDEVVERDNTDLCYVVTELISESVADLFDPPLRAASQSLIGWIDLIAQSGEALAIARAAGLTHGNIKPSNMRLERTYLARPDASGYLLKLTDFGFNGIEFIERGAGTSLPWMSEGLAYALAPEHFHGDEPDVRTDVYALGSILYRAATGQPPFNATTFDAALRQRVYGEPVPPRDRQAALSEELSATITRSLKSDPARRYSDAQALADALRRALVLPEDRVPVVQALDLGGRALKSVRLTGNGLAVGRQPAVEPGLVLPAEVLSDIEVWIDWDGAQVSVSGGSDTCIASLQGQRLLPSKTYVWVSDEILRIGPYLLQYTQPSAIALAQPLALPQSVTPGAGTTPAPAPNEHEERIVVSLPQKRLELVPTQLALFQVSLKNVGKLVDNLDITVEGIPGQWIEGVVSTVNLNPNDERLVDIRVRVPATSKNRAREYPVLIRVTSRPLGDTWSQQAVWHVQPFAASTLDLRPKRRHGRRWAKYIVVVRNLGNQDATFRLLGEDEAHLLDCDLDLLRVDARPGQVVEVPLTVRPQHKIWFGASERHRFTIDSTPHGPGEARSVAGTFEQMPVFPRWLLGAVVVGFVLVLLGAYLFRFVPEQLEQQLNGKPGFGVLRPSPTLIPTITPLPLLTATPTVMLSPTPVVEPIAQFVPPSTPTATASPAPTATPTPVPSATPVILVDCPVRGVPYMIEGSGAEPGGRLDLFFDQRRVGGDNVPIDASGNYQLPLLIGDEPPGLHIVSLVQGDRVLQQFTCQLKPLLP
ncbi:MAG TPA: protein kinase [Kouleothrix sp.]|nr:protein kinase [Kouleothrix sp.]